MEVIASVATGTEAVRVFRETKPDVTIMDLTLTKEMSGIQAIHAIRDEFPDARIVVLSAYKRDEDVFRAFQAGAVSYLLKETLGDDLVPIIRSVNAGNGPIPSEVGRQLADHVKQPTLSLREIEVLQLVADGLRNKEIATHLHISTETVQGHIKNILSKLKVHDRTEAVTVAIRRGILHIG